MDCQLLQIKINSVRKYFFHLWSESAKDYPDILSQAKISDEFND